MRDFHSINRPYVFALIVATTLVVVGFNACHANGTAMKNQGQHFYIDIGKTAETRLLNKVRSLKTGTSVDVAKATVGKPTEDKMLIGKKGEFRARLLRYYIRKQDKGLVNEIHDQYVSLYFDKSDKLTSIGYKLTDQSESEINDKTQ